MKKKVFALILCLAMVMSLLPATVLAAETETVAEETTENWTVTGIVVANERYAIDTDPRGNSIYDMQVYPTGIGSGESLIYFEGKTALGDVYIDVIAIDRALNDDMLGAKVIVNFTADKHENNGFVGYKNVEVVGDVILHEDTVAYTVQALDVDIMPNGESTSATEIRPYISFMVDGNEHKIEMSTDVDKVAKNVDAQVDTWAAEAISAEISQYAYVLDDYYIVEDCDLVHPAGTEFIAGMGWPSLAQYRFVSVDGGNTYSYMFKMIDDARYPGNIGYGYVSAYNRASGTIRITGVGMFDLGSEVVVDSKVQVDDPVIICRENGKISVKPIEVFNAAVESFTDNGVMLNGKEYFAWINNEDVYGAGYNTIFEYYNDEKGAMSANTTYYTYNNLILEIDASSSSVGKPSEYAVVIQSYYDADMDAAYVKLGFADDTEGTYKVGKTYTPKPSDLSYAGNNRMMDFANNSAFGYVLKYTLLSDGTVDLSAQDLKAVNDSDSTLRTFRDGGSVVDGKFNGLYSYSDDTIVYALYGNPGYYVNGTAVEVDTTMDGYKPVKSKALKLSEIKDMNAGYIENLYMASFIDGAIECINEGMGSYVVNTAAQANRYVVAGAMTVGDNLSGIMYYETDSLAYVVSATQKYNSATKKYYAELTLINEDGLIKASTVDDVKDLTGSSVLESEYLGTLNELIGGFVRFGMDDDGKIDVLETYGNEVNTSFDWNSQGLYLVNLTQNRNGIISFYDTDADVEISWEAADSLEMHEDGCELIGIDGDKYVGEKLTFVSKYVTSLPADEGGNAVIQIEEGKIVRIFSFTPNYVVDGSLADFDEIKEGAYEDLSWNFTYGAVTYCSEEKDIIKIVGATPVEGTYKLSDLTIRGDVVSDSLVVCYKDGDECVVEAVETVTGNIEEFTSDGVIVGGNEYHLWPESEIACDYSSFFEFWSDTKEEFTSDTKFLVHDNFILDVEFDEAPASIENYAVVLRSYYDADTDTAYVKLGFTDDTEGTYAVGKLYTPKPTDLTAEDNNRSQDFDMNQYFGYIVEYSLLDDGSVDLSMQDLKNTDSDSKLYRYSESSGIRIVDSSKFMGKYAYNDDSVVFALYGNPGYVGSGTSIKVDAASTPNYCVNHGHICSSYSYDYGGYSCGCSDNYCEVVGYAPVKAKAYKLSELELLIGNIIPNLATGGVVNLDAWNTCGTYILNTTKTPNNYVVAASVTVGAALSQGRAAVKSSPTLGYVVSAEQRYNVSTDKYYATLTLISEDGKISTKTVDDVQNYSSVSMLDPDYGVGKLDSWRGAFVSYELNDDGVISNIDTCDEYGCPYDVKNTFDYSYGQPAQGLYLVNTYGLRGDVLQFYDTDSDVDVKSTPAMAAQLSEKGCDIIAVDGDDYAGSMLSFISNNISYISQYDGIWTNGDGAGNAVIYINEDGEIEKIFSFTDDEYSVISYDLNGGEGSISSFTKRTGTNVTLSETIPTRENYTFKGWAESADATEAEYQPGGLYDGDADVTLYAVWEANKYTVTYLVDGEEYKSYELAYGEAITPEAEPEKSGYIFSGWSEIPETMPAENVTITGTFEEIEIVDAAGVELNKTALSITEGKTETLTATVLPADATNKNVTWKSSNTNVASVINGVVTAKSVGTATITATTVDGGYKATCEVTVTESVAPMIYVSDVRARLGQTFEVTVSLKNNPGFGGLAYDVFYDNEVITLVSYETDLGKDICTSSAIDRYENKVNFQYASANEIEGDGELVTLTFTVKEDAPTGITEIKVVPEEETFFGYEGYEEIVYILLAKDGSVEIVEYTPGDINDDGNVNNRDAARILQHLAGWDVEYVEPALDVNGDGKVNNRDAARLLQYLAGWDVEIH